MINWKLEQIIALEEKEEKAYEDNLEREQKQIVFDMVFKLDETTTTDYFDRIKSAASNVSRPGTVLPINESGQKNSLEERRRKVAATKFILQVLLGKWIIPMSSCVLLVLYFTVVIEQC